MRKPPRVKPPRVKPSRAEQRTIRMVQRLLEEKILTKKTAEQILYCIQNTKETKDTPPNACETIHEVRRLWITQTLDWPTAYRIIKCIQKVTKRSDTDCLEALLARSVKHQER